MNYVVELTYHTNTHRSSYVSVSRTMQELFSSSNMYQKFLDAVTQSFLPTIVKQAEGHKTSTLPTIEDWLHIRVQNFAFDCFRTFFEFDDPLPEDIISGQILHSFAAKAGLMACLANVSISMCALVGDTVRVSYAHVAVIGSIFLQQGAS